MKKIYKTPLFVLILAIFSIFSFSKVSAQGYGRVSFDVFYDELSPYGYWENDATYGDIWFPDVPSGFRPYSTNGYWAMTQYGNTWVSNYPWGWAPFHYGRWVYTSYNGWGWIPGYEWGPAWVDWRSGNGYYGWAPMMPRVGIHVSIGVPVNLWIFAPSRHIYSRNVYRYAYVGRTNIYNRTTIINNTYIVNNNHYYGGPSRREMERTLGRRISVRDVRQSDRPGASRSNNRSVSIYRPDHDRNRVADSRRTENTRRDGVGSNTRSRQDIQESQSRRSGSTRTNSTRREMYIGRDGTATIRENTDNRQNGNTNVSRRESGNTVERRSDSRQNESRNEGSLQRGEQQRSDVPNNRSIERNNRIEQGGSRSDASERSNGSFQNRSRRDNSSNIDRSSTARRPTPRQEQVVQQQAPATSPNTSRTRESVSRPAQAQRIERSSSSNQNRDSQRSSSGRNSSERSSGRSSR